MATRSTLLRSNPRSKSAAILGRLRRYRLDDPLFESVVTRKVVPFPKLRRTARCARRKLSFSCIFTSATRAGSRACVRTIRVG